MWVPHKSSDRRLVNPVSERSSSFLDRGHGLALHSGCVHNVHGPAEPCADQQDENHRARTLTRSRYHHDFDEGFTGILGSPTDNRLFNTPGGAVSMVRALRVLGEIVVDRGLAEGRLNLVTSTRPRVDVSIPRCRVVPKATER